MSLDMELADELVAQRKPMPGRWSIVFAISAAVIAVDQTLKWWAWRHISWTLVNTAGDPLVGRLLGRLYADRLPGAVLDFLDAGLLIVAMWTLVARRPSVAVLVSGALMMAGWSSNLLDRLGLHFLTAPGSARGAVDFIHLGRYFYNVADFVTTGATVLFLLLLITGYLARHAASLKVALRQRPHTWKLTSVAVGALGLIIAVSFGAANDGANTTTFTTVSSSSGSSDR